MVELYFIFMYIWMNCILFSLYVAMLLDNFNIPEKNKITMQKRIFDRKELIRRCRDNCLVSTAVSLRAFHLLKPRAFLWPAQPAAQEVRPVLPGERDQGGQGQGDGGLAELQSNRSFEHHPPATLMPSVSGAFLTCFRAFL